MSLTTLPRSASPSRSVRNGRWEFLDARRGLLPCSWFFSTRWSAIESLLDESRRNPRLLQASVSECSPHETTFIAAKESKAYEGLIQ